MTSPKYLTIDVSYPDGRRHVIRVNQDFLSLQWFDGSKPMAQPHLIALSEARAILARANSMLDEP